MDDKTRWAINVAAETDIALRTYLAQRGIKKGDLSKFIEEAVKWRLLDLSLSEARSVFEDVLPEKMDQLINEAVERARTH